MLQRIHTLAPLRRLAGTSVGRRSRLLRRRSTNGDVKRQVTLSAYHTPLLCVAVLRLPSTVSQPVILIQAEANPTGKNEDIDFFNDMQPEIKKAKKVRRLAVMRVPFLDFEPVGILLVSLKVVLKSKTQQAPRGNRNLFGFTEDSSVDVVS